MKLSVCGLQNFGVSGHRITESIDQCLADDGMANRHFRQSGQVGEKRQILLIEVVTGIDAQTCVQAASAARANCR